jgi:Antibiotic biosynthesis monooxygenase
MRRRADGMRMADEPILTTIEARVPRERWDDLLRGYAALSGEDVPERLGGYLVQSAEDPEAWRGISLWRSAAALQAYRARVAVPAGLKLFRDVAGETTLRRDVVRARD